MEILNYNDEHKDFRKKLVSFLEKEVTPNADKWEEEHIVPKSVWKKMGENGFLCPCLEPEYGGIGGDFLYSVIVAEEMLKTRQSGLMASLHSDVVVPYIHSYGSEETKKKYLPKCASGECITAVAMTEPDAGSDISSIKTTAKEEDDFIIIDGSKTFISNGINCDIVIVAACDPLVKDPYQALSLYIVDDGTPGFKRGKQLMKMGFHSQDTSELFFNNCKIPKSNRLGDKGMGFYMLMEKLQQERLVCSIGAVAAAEYMLNETITYCKNTRTKSGKPLSKFQATQFAIVEMATEIKAGRIFLEKLIADHIEGNNVVIETSMAKYWTTQKAKEIGYQCLDLWGQDAMVEKCPVVRAWRDVRILSIFAGTNEIMKGIAAKFMGL